MIVARRVAAVEAMCRDSDAMRPEMEAVTARNRPGVDTRSMLGTAAICLERRQEP